MILYWLILSLLAARVLGGRFSKLAHLKIRAGYLLTGLVIAQIGAILLRPQYPLFGGILFILTYFGLLLISWQNRKLPGMLLILTGIFLNFAVITVNGGAMPISQKTLERIGRASEVTNLTTPSWGGGNSGYPGEAPSQNQPGIVHNSKDSVSATALLPFLGDVIVLPLPGRLASALSPGDLMIGLGLSWLVLKIMQARVAFLTGFGWRKLSAR
jgi:hypothetical protein